MSNEAPEQTKVSWKIPEMSGDLEYSRVFPTRGEAERQADDIRSYEGVTEVTVSPVSGLA